MPSCKQRAICNVYYGDDKARSKSVWSIPVKYDIDIYLAKGTFGGGVRPWTNLGKLGKCSGKQRGPSVRKSRTVACGGQCLAT